MAEKQRALSESRLISCDRCQQNDNVGNEIPKATQYCIDCHEYYCSKCSEHHGRLKVKRHHTIVDIKESLKLSPEDAGTFPTIRMERQRAKLIEIMESEFGLLDHFLSSGVIPYNEIEMIRAVKTRYKRNEKLIEYIFNNHKHQDLLTALSRSSQIHLANWITGDGNHRNEFGLDWPLLAIEHAILNQNQTFLVDILDAGNVTEKLWSEEAINGWQKELIESKATSHERNVALLDIVRRSSRKTYYMLASSLRDYQDFISDILEDGGVILAVHTALEDDDLIETEKKIVTKMASMLYRKATSKEKANRLLDELLLQVIAAKRGVGIVIYIRCRIEKDLNRLREVIANTEMEKTLERLFNLLLKKTTIKVLSAKIFEQDLQKAIEIFANTPGSPRLKNQESTDKKNVADQQLGAAMSRPKKEYEKDDQLKSPKEIGCFAIVIGTDDGTSISEDVLKINLNRTEEFSSLQQLPTEMVKESAAAVFRNSIFVTGIGNDHDEIWKLDATLSAWSKCASMIQGRRRHSIGFVDQVLYICGGYVDSDEIALDDVEAYVVANDKFAHVGKLLYAVYSAGKCVNYKASLYIFGGCGSNDKLAHKVQVYDTKFNTCTLLSTPMPRSRGLLRAEIFGNTVILFGRYNCFIYNIDTEIWNARDQFRTDVSNFGLSINKGKVFVIGGGYAIRDDSGDRKWICRDDVRCVPVVNIMTDKPIEWRHHATLPKRLLVDAFGTIDHSETG